MAETFRVIDGVALTRDAWLTVVNAGRAAFDAALGGEDFGNLMESRMVADEMAADGDVEAVAHVTRLDALVTAAEAARDAAEAAALATFR